MAFTANTLRKQIGEMPFPFWARDLKDGTFWAAVDTSEARPDTTRVLRERIEALGHTTAMHGRPATSGEYAITVTPA
jgi:hypothetical protein